MGLTLEALAFEALALGFFAPWTRQASEVLMATSDADTHNVEKWFPSMQPAVQARVRAIEAQLHTLIDVEHKTIYPPLNRLFYAMQCTPPNCVKAIIIGQDPYHGLHQANGMAFSVNDGVKFPPSLRNIFVELVNDLGVAMPTSGNLEPWARQGVLLLNASLSVEEHKPNSHVELGWNVVTQEILRVALMHPQPKVLLCWGNFAFTIVQDALSHVDAAAARNACVLRSTHPSPFSALRAAGRVPAFMGSRPFSRTNEFLRAHGVEPIDWRLP